MKINLKNSLAFLVHFIPLLLIFVIFIFPLTGNGLIVGGDWTFPYSNKELSVFGRRAYTIWSQTEIPLGTQVSHNNLYLFQILAHLWASLGLDGVSFQKITLFLTIIGIYVFSYRLFVKLTKSRFASMVGALGYLFSPIVFNYLNMGWNYVLLFLALAPLFTQIALDYFRDGKNKQIIALGLISAISFFQSQSIVWLPLMFICIFISQVSQKNLLGDIRKFLLATIGIGSIVMIVHLPWLLPIVLNPNNIISGTSSLDLKRFSEVLSVSNQFRLRGSLYNQEFEFAFPWVLTLFSFFPIILCISSPLFSRLRKQLPVYVLMLLLTLVAPTLYIFRDSIASLPFSIVVRDVSRFLVLSSLGISMGIAISLSVINNLTVRLIFCMALILSVTPYFTGRLYTLSGNPSPQSNEYKDFRARLLTLPETENESLAIPFSNQTNIFLPTGGFIFTKTDKRFNRDFWGVADVQGNFSPIASGIYYTDKSGFLISNLVQNYSTLSRDIDYLMAFFRIYGIDNLIYRSGLESTYKSQLDRIGIQEKCQPIVPQSDSDWSITSICSIKDTYPLFYSSVSPQYTNKSLSEILSEKHNRDRTVVLGCPESLKEESDICNSIKIDKLSSSEPPLKFEKISATKYSLKTNGVEGKFLLVFNKTYHPGWILFDGSGNKLDYPHLLVNQLVNGWVIEPVEGQDQAEYLVEFTPQVLYSKLLPISLISILVMMVYLIYRPKSKIHEK